MAFPFLIIGGLLASTGLSFIAGMFGQVKPKYRAQPSMLPDVEPTVPVISDIGNRSMRSSLTYGYTGPANGSSPGLPIPILGGTMLIGAQLINSYLESSGTSEVAYALFSLCWGELEEPVLDDSRDSIWVGDRKLSELPGSDFVTRSGTYSQTGITPWFEFLHQMRSINRSPKEANRLIMEMEYALPTDDSYFQHTVTNGTYPPTRVGVAPVGSYWREFSGNDLCYIDVAGDSCWDFGADDFTIEMYIQADSMTSGRKYGLIGWQNSADDSGWLLQLISTGASTAYLHLLCDIRTTGVPRTVAYSVAFDAVTSVVHIALVRRGASYMFFVDGADQTAEQDKVDWGRSMTAPSNVAVAMRVGYRSTQDGTNDYNFDGKMDSVRISKGVARYTSDFTPPTTAHEMISSDSYVSKGNIDRIKFQLSFPAGLYTQASGGEIETKSVQFDIHIKTPGTSNFWWACGNYWTVYGACAGPFKVEKEIDFRTIHYDNPSVGVQFIRGERIVGNTSGAAATCMVDDYTNTVVWIFDWNGIDWIDNEEIEGQTYGHKADVDETTYPAGELQTGEYEVRFIRRTPDDAKTADHSVCIWSYVDEMLTRTLQYPRIALVGVKIPSSDQTGSDLGTVKFLSKAGDQDLPNWVGGTTSRDTSNPAWFLLKVMTSVYEGSGVDVDRLNQTAWEAWATACDYDVGSGVKRCRWNGILDSTTSARDIVQMVGKVGRAQVREEGNVFYPVLEGPTSTVSHLFSSGNSGAYSYKSLVGTTAEKIHGFKIWYYDEDDDYKKKPYLYCGPDYDISSTSLNVPEETLIGCTSEDEAKRYAILRYNLATMLRGECSLETGLEALTVLPGDLAYIQNNAHRETWGGRIVGLSGDTFTLDREVTLDSDFFGNGHGRIVVKKASSDPQVFVIHSDSLGSLTDEIKCTTTPSGYDDGDVYAIGHKELHPWMWRVLGVRRTGKLKFSLRCIQYLEEAYQHSDYSGYI